MQSRKLLPIAFAALLLGCAKQPEPVSLSRADGASYQTLVTFYADDGGSAWRPFKLETTIDRRSDERQHVLVAEQCEDVGVIQTPKAIYVFYGEMVLQDFGSMTYDQQEPRTFLCDLQLPLCKATREALIGNGSKLTKICPSRTPDGQPGP